jgi:hypothetical protein
MEFLALQSFSLDRSRGASRRPVPSCLLMAVRTGRHAGVTSGLQTVRPAA